MRVSGVLLPDFPYPLCTHYQNYRVFIIVGKIVGTAAFLRFAILGKPCAMRVSGFSVSDRAFPYQGCALPTELYQRMIERPVLIYHKSAPLSIVKMKHFNNRKIKLSR